jgi:hypothetical protein
MLKNIEHRSGDPNLQIEVTVFDNDEIRIFHKDSPACVFCMRKHFMLASVISEFPVPSNSIRSGRLEITTPANDLVLVSRKFTEDAVLVELEQFEKIKQFVARSFEELDKQKRETL